jgi:hypothetical protein
MLPAFLARLLAGGRAAHSAKNGQAMSIFHKVSKKPAGKCQLKHHFTGGAYEVMGILDLWAKNDPERFVCPRVDKIVAQCKKYQTKELYGKRWLEKILRELRRHHIISRRLTRTRDYNELEGFIVAPHEALTARKPASKGKTVCIFLGQCWEDGCWKKEIVEETDSQGRRVTKVRAVHWVAPGAKPVDRPVSNSDATPVSKPVDRPVSNSVTTLQHADDGERVTGDFPAEPIEPSQSWEPEKPTQPTEPIEPASASSQDTAEKGNGHGQIKTNTEGLGFSSSSTTVTDQKQNPETIAQHFASGGVDMNDITDGLFEETEQSEHFDEVDVKTLLQICDAVIQDFGQRRYLGRKTHGDIMAEAMVRFTKKYGENVPLYWYPIAKQLRAPAGKRNSVREVSVSTTAAVREMAREIAARPPCPDCGAKHPMPPCGNRVAPYQPFDHKNLTRE